MRIGRLELASNLLLAPIAGYCDLSFRLVVRPLGGLGLACTDLISARGLIEESRGCQRLMRSCSMDRPLCVQLYGRDPAFMARAAMQAADAGAAAIDINMGCPADKVTRRSGGAALLCNPAGATRLAEAVVRAVSVPVMVKVRLGPDAEHLVAPGLARAFADAGVAAMTVHGRTTAQRFRGPVSLDGIAAVVAAAGSMPIIGNGDVKTPQDAAAMIERTGCAGVMIGRGALRDPWLIRDTDAFLRTGHVPPAPTVTERVALIVRHFNLMVETLGERRACHKIRQRISWYANKLGPCKRFKEAVRVVHSAAAFRRAVETFLAEDDAPGTATVRAGVYS
jgi:nifR3 family TIM-barrel protein